jgi:hypothetical protein
LTVTVVFAFADLARARLTLAEAFFFLTATVFTVLRLAAALTVLRRFAAVFFVLVRLALRRTFFFAAM